jgi:predicted Zn-dependent protease with MMP-like domain
MTPTSDDETPDLDALLDEAETALNDGHVERALGLLDGPAHEADADPEVRAMFGLALHYAGDYDEAFDYLTEAVSEDPDDVECRGALGVCHFHRLEFVTAEKELRRAILSEGDWAEAHYWLGRVLEFRGRYPEAMIEFQRAQSLDREHYAAPERLPDDELDRIVNEALAALPPRIQDAVSDVTILVEEYPDEDLLREFDPPASPELLGVFSGPNYAERAGQPSGAMPSSVRVFRRNLEHMAGDRTELVDELRVTLLHEIGHALGMGEEELEALGLE